MQDVIDVLETVVRDLEKIQIQFGEMMPAIHDLQEEFEANDSEIETVARESVSEMVAYIWE